MKWMLCALLIVGTVRDTKAQSFEEWLDQKETGLRYLLEQIVALKGYAEVVWKGYAIAEEGLGFIHDLKEGDFQLHQGYFSSLKKINPSIANTSIVNACLTLKAAIAKESDRLKRIVLRPDVLAGERRYIEDVLQALSSRVTLLSLELKRLLEEDTYSLKGDERLTRIGAIHSAIIDQYSFIESFSAGVKTLYAAHEREALNIGHLKELQGIK